MIAADLSPRAKVLVIAGTLLGMLVSAIDQTVVSTALPRIIGELGGLSLFSWVFTAYMLTSTITVPVVGKLGDMYGRKPFFMAGIVIFTLASALAGLSQNMTQLIIFRGLQGFGAGAIMSNSFSIIGDLFPPSERGKFMGLFSAVFGLASVAGPTVGGTITDNLSWRWVFYVNIPVGAVALSVLWYGFPWVRGGQRSRVDYLGAAMMTLAIVPLLLALVWGGDQYAWRSPQIAALLALAGGAAIAFVQVEARAAEPILPLELFRNRVFQVTTVVTFVSGIGMFGAISFMPLFIQGALGASATNSGTVVLPMMLGMVVSSFISGQVIARVGRYRVQFIIGNMVLVAGMFLLSRMTEETSRLTASVNMVVVGAGIGLGFPILSLAVQNALPHRLLGVVTSSTQFFRQIGGTLGVAIFGTLVNTHLRENLAQNLPADVTSMAPPDLIMRLADPQVLLSPAALEQLRAGFEALGEGGPRIFEGTVLAMRMTLAEGLSLVFFVGFIISIIALVIGVLMPEIPLRTTIEAEDELAARPAAASRAPVAATRPRRLVLEPGERLPADVAAALERLSRPRPVAGGGEG